MPFRRSSGLLSSVSMSEHSSVEQTHMPTNDTLLESWIVGLQRGIISKSLGLTVVEKSLDMSGYFSNFLGCIQFPMCIPVRRSSGLLP